MCMGDYEDRELFRDILLDKEPDKIDAALALAWRCDKCGYVANSKVPIKIPAPCVQCGGTIFRVVNRSVACFKARRPVRLAQL
jgi:predicted Zn-ribbon and HTH transcriptional regulator